MMAGNTMMMGMPTSVATGMPASMTTGMPPSMTTGTMGMGGLPVNQGMMGMNMSMNMGMAAPVMMGSMTGMGVPGVGMGLTHSITPAVGQPKQDAFANFGNFGKWRSANNCVSVSVHDWSSESVNHRRTAVLEDNFAWIFSLCFCSFWRASDRSPSRSVDVIWRQGRAPTGTPYPVVTWCVKWCHTEGA